MLEQYRKEYNEIRPHSALNYRPPAPCVELTKAKTLSFKLVQKMGLDKTLQKKNFCQLWGNPNL